MDRYEQHGDLLLNLYLANRLAMPNPSLERDLHRHGTWPAKRWFLSSASRAKRHPGSGSSAQTLGRSGSMSALEPQLLLTVEDAFLISGRGCMLIPGLVAGSVLPLQRGDLLQLLLPGGQTAETAIYGLEAIHNRKSENPEIRFYITLPKQIRKEDVPTGTKVFWFPKVPNECKT